MMYNKKRGGSENKEADRQSESCGHTPYSCYAETVGQCHYGRYKKQYRNAYSVEAAHSDDSSTILAQGGAEKLLGKGDMLFMSEASPEPVRLQGSFISTEEVTEVVSYLKEHNETHYNDNAIKKITHSKQGAGGEGEDKETDPYFYDALKYCIEKNSASISMLQRRFQHRLQSSGENCRGYGAQTICQRIRRNEIPPNADYYGKNTTICLVTIDDKGGCDFARMRQKSR